MHGAYAGNSAIKLGAGELKKTERTVRQTVLSTKWFLDGDVNQSITILNENLIEDTLFTVFLAFFLKGRFRATRKVWTRWKNRELLTTRL